MCSRPQERQTDWPVYETNLAKHLEELEAELRKPSDDDTAMPEEDVKEVLDNAALLIRNETENNLHHVYRSGDYIISKRGVRWMLDATGMLRPDNGGSPIPLMKDGFYSNQAMQLAQSGRVGYGKSSYEDIQKLRNLNRSDYAGPNPRDVTERIWKNWRMKQGMATPKITFAPREHVGRKVKHPLSKRKGSGKSTTRHVGT